MSLYTSHITTSDPISRLHETILYLQHTDKFWVNNIPVVYGFERDCRVTLDIVRSFGAHDPQFYSYLDKHIKQNFKDRATHHGDQAIVKRLTAAIVQGHFYLSKHFEASNPRTTAPKRRSFFSRPEPTIDYRASFEQEAANLREEIECVERNMRFAALTEKSTLEDFKEDIPLQGHEFWVKKFGTDVAVTWLDFAQTYTLLYGRGGPVKLDRIQGYLFGNSTEKVNIFTIYAFITLTRHHGFPFASTAEKSQDVSSGDRMELAKVVIGLMDKFASSEMQQNFLTLAQYFRGIPKTDKRSIERRADEWAVARKESRMITNDDEKSERHLEADRVDFARRSVSFFYQQYMVLWRVGQPQSDMLSEIDFPGKGRLREFVAFSKPLDYANFHYVLSLEPERWPTAQPDVYHFTKTLLLDKTKDVPKQKKDGTAPSTPKPDAVTKNA